ncbi:MAG: DUF1839 family protein [Candidatus Saccharimonas sp.]|nr:DUF1839 family protein [Planctomycetaceae bacterium]
MTKHVFPLDPSSYQRHLIHTRERNWAETNCYVDLWIELLHAWGFEPMAALPFTLAIDFEGDQWTFFKFPLADLWELYGLDVQELAIWRPVASHVEEQVGLRRPVLVELDSFYLPDTAGTAYQHQHVKTTVAAIEIDIQNLQLGYFHGQGYYHLNGEDFVNIFNLEGVKHPAVLPPYAEFVKRRPSVALEGDDLVKGSLKLLQRQLHLLPEVNPFSKFKPRFESDLQWLANEPIETFHQYSFATLRQFGSCYEVASTYLGWLQSQGISQLERPIAAFSELSTGAKTMQFQLARAMARKKPMDLSVLDQMAATWEVAIEDLNAQFS